MRSVCAVILKPREAAKRFVLSRYPPSPELAFFVECHWVVRWDLRVGESYTHEALPHPCVNIAVDEGGSGSGVFGVFTKKHRRVLTGCGRAIGTRFKPGGAYPFLRISMSELTDRRLSVRRCFGAQGETLDCDVLARCAASEQVALLDAFLRERLPPFDENVATATRIVRLMLDDPELRRVGDVADRVGLSTRTIQRLFQRYVGVGPKWVIRRFRLHEAAERAANGAQIDWVATALELGYYDHAHFIREFKALIGCSPAKYAAACAAT
jgi:AraC-like DNA-binding protein